MGSAVLMGGSQIGLILTPGVAVVAWALVLGFSTALSFIVVLSLPARLAPAGDVARMSAAVFTLQYAIGFFMPLIAGALWDATGQAAFAFVPGIVAGFVMAWGALSLRVPHEVA